MLEPRAGHLVDRVLLEARLDDEAPILDADSRLLVVQGDERPPIGNTHILHQQRCICQFERHLWKLLQRDTLLAINCSVSVSRHQLLILAAPRIYGRTFPGSEEFLRLCRRV